MPTTPLIAVNDILHYIVSHLAIDLDVPTPESPRFELDDSGADDARQALARLAIAHSTFTKPALAALWRFLPSDEALKHLLCVVGIAQKSPHGGGWITPAMVLTGTPATHELGWARFQEYASRVRAITIDPSSRTFDLPAKLVHDTFWSQVSSAFGDAPILPRLEAATLFSINPFALFDFDMGALCLLNPSLRELNVICPGVGPAEQFNFQRVLSSCLPSSHSLEVLSVIVPVAVLEIETLPQRYPGLRRLKVDEDGIHPDQLALFATLPNLEHLSIVITPYAPLDRPITFAELRSLDVFSYDFDGVGFLISHLDAPKLQSVAVSENHEDSDDTCLQALTTHLHTLVQKHPSLTAFRWVSRDTSSFGNSRIAHMTLAALFAPLLDLPAMRCFSVCFTRPLIPCLPSDFQKMAEAWPALEDFYVRIVGGRSDADEPTGLESLATFARCCPRLRYLRVPSVTFDPDAPAPAAVTGMYVPGGRLPHALRELEVGGVVLTSEEGAEAARQGRVLRGLMQQIFPVAKIRFPIRASLGRRAAVSHHEEDEDVEDEEDEEDGDKDEDEDEDEDEDDDSDEEEDQEEEEDYQEDEDEEDEDGDDEDVDSADRL